MPYADVSLPGARRTTISCAQLDAALAEPADDPRRAERRRVAEENDWAHRYEAIDAGLAPSAYPLVSVVVVTYGGLELTRACLESLLRGETWPRLEVIVVDNASTDGTPEYLRTLAAADPRVRVHPQRREPRLRGGQQPGVRRSRAGEIVVLLNNDTVVPPGLLGRLAATCSRDRRSASSARRRTSAATRRASSPDYADISGLPAFAARRARGARGAASSTSASPRCTASRCGATSSTQVGPLDEAYGVGMFEDDDFAVRMRRPGYRVVCAEDAYVHHVGQGAFRKLSPAEYEALWKKNKAYFEKKWRVSWKPHQPRVGTIPSASKIGT